MKVFALFLTFYFIIPIYSQLNLPVIRSKSNFSFRKLNIEDGLSTLFIEHILQDRYGFIWIATQYGLNLYDGYEMKVFKSDNYKSSTLSSDYVTKVYEDKSGNIWACTIRGLSKFERSTETFQSFFPDPININSDCNYILGVEEDSKGLLWVFTPEALFSLNTKTGKFNDYRRDSIVMKENWTYYSKFVKRSVEDQDSNVWITSSKGLWKFDRKKGRLICFSSNPADSTSLSSNDIIAIDKDSQGVIWVTTRNSGLNKIIFNNDQNKSNSVSFKRYTKKSGDLASDSLINLLVDSRKKIWVTGLNGISVYNPEKDKFDFYRINGKNVLRMDESILGGYWIKTDNDFYWFDIINKSLVEYTDYEGFKNMKKKNYYICNKGSLWTTFEGNGIQILYSWQNPIKQIFNENNLEGLTSDNKKINKILLDRNDNLWLGTYGGVVRIINFSNGDYSNYRLYKNIPGNRSSISDNSVLALLEASDGTIWFGTEKGLSKYNPNKDNFQNFYHDQDNPKSLQFKYVQDLYEDSRGVLWVLTQNGPDILDRKTGFFYHLNSINPGINDDYYITIAEDSNGSIWLGDFEQGLTKIDFPSELSNSKSIIDQMLESFKISHFKNLPGNLKSISGNSIISLYNDSQKRFWVGTGKGLNLYMPQERRFICINEDDGIENEIICGILDDAEGNIWLSSKRGISKVSIDKDFSAANFKEKISIINFNMSDGLQGLEYLEKSFFKSKKGLLFFGGLNGFNYVISESVKPEYFPVTQLTKFYKLNKRVYFSKPIYELDSIKLMHRENNFSFEFVGLGYKKSWKIQYRYMLENFDEHWIECGSQRKVSYTSIAPGDYIFKVQASDEFGNWNDKFASIHIFIKSPFWKTWWFELIATIFIIFLIVGYNRFRLRNLLIQKKHLLSEVEKRTIEITNKSNELKAQNEEITTQRDLLSIQNNAITESIVYAKRIQTAVLPQLDYIYEILKESFILYKPRDVVSGDFYWVRQINNIIVIVVADCTGHGVPGAILSMLGISFLSEIVQKREITCANQVLNELRKQFKYSLRHKGEDGGIDDGMDISLCALDTITNMLQFAGANNPLFLIQNNKLIEIEPDRMPIGFYPNEKPSFTNHEIQLNEGDIFYLFSDGFTDQFGGERGFKYKTANFQKILFQNHNKPMEIQKELLEEELKTWMGKYSQTDDILVMGVRV
jgi:ligand-binding sensor domain-containing protein/serine phosphatase RsbU (regulator of sigma subunit)